MKLLKGILTVLAVLTFPLWILPMLLGSAFLDAYHDFYSWFWE